VGVRSAWNASNNNNSISNNNNININVGDKMSTGGKVGVGSDPSLRVDNGMRLDKTPTDDEINWLWEKVRDCLSREPTPTSTAEVQSHAGNDGSKNRNVTETFSSVPSSPQQPVAQVLRATPGGDVLGKGGAGSRGGNTINGHLRGGNNRNGVAPTQSPEGTVMNNDDRIDPSNRTGVVTNAGSGVVNNGDGVTRIDNEVANGARVNSTYSNNYMGSTYPTRQRITMDMLQTYSKKTSDAMLLARKPTAVQMYAGGRSGVPTDTHRLQGGGVYSPAGGGQEHGFSYRPQASQYAPLNAGLRRVENGGRATSAVPGNDAQSELWAFSLFFIVLYLFISASLFKFDIYIFSCLFVCLLFGTSTTVCILYKTNIKIDKH